MNNEKLLHEILTEMKKTNTKLDGIEKIRQSRYTHGKS